MDLNLIFNLVSKSTIYLIQWIIDTCALIGYVNPLDKLKFNYCRSWIGSFDTRSLIIMTG